MKCEFFTCKMERSKRRLVWNRTIHTPIYHRTCFINKINQNFSSQFSLTKTCQIEEEEEEPRTGPLPASSIPMRQGWEAHSGVKQSDSIPINKQMQLGFRVLSHSRLNLCHIEFWASFKTKALAFLLTRKITSKQIETSHETTEKNSESFEQNHDFRKKGYNFSVVIRDKGRKLTREIQRDKQIGEGAGILLLSEGKMILHSYSSLIKLLAVLCSLRQKSPAHNLLSFIFYKSFIVIFRNHFF